MQRQKQQVSAVWTFFQKIIQHLKYRGGSFSSNDYDENFLGLSVLSWMNWQNRMYYFVRSIKDFSFKTKYAFKCLTNFWKIPNALYSLTNAAYAAERIFIEMKEEKERLNECIDRLLVDLIEARISGVHYKSIDQDKWQRKQHSLECGLPKQEEKRQQYFEDRGLFVFQAEHKDVANDKENIAWLYEQYDRKIPSQYLNEKERDDRIDEECDAHYLAMAENEWWYDEDTFHYDQCVLELDKVFFDKDKVQKEEFEKRKKQIALSEQYAAEAKQKEVRDDAK